MTLLTLPNVLVTAFFVIYIIFSIALTHAETKGKVIVSLSLRMKFLLFFSFILFGMPIGIYIQENFIFADFIKNYNLISLLHTFIVLILFQIPTKKKGE